MDLGDIALGQTLRFTFTTRQFSTGTPHTLGGTPAMSAFVNGSTTPITAGITLTTDFGGVTGLNHVAVAATSGNGFAAQSDVSLVLTAGSVDGVSVAGEAVRSFSIENRSGLRPATAGRTLVVDAAGLADANMVKMGPTGAGTAQTARDIGASVLLSSGTGTGQIKLTAGYPGVNWGDVTGQSATVNLSATTVGEVGTVLDAMEDTDIRASIGMASANLDDQFVAIPAAVWANVSRTLTAGTNIVLVKGTGITGLNDLDAAGVRAAVGLATGNLDTQLADAKGTTQMTESYAANGVAPTRDQAIMAIHQMLMHFIISGTSITVKKLDGTNDAFVVTLDDDTNPTSAVRS